jgi:hypothetical protein
MRLKRKVLLLTMVLASVGIAKAIDPNAINTQASIVKPVSETEDPTAVLTNVVEKTVQTEMESVNPDSLLNDDGYLNLTFQFNVQPDSTDFSVVQYYIKHILPVIKNVDSKRIDSVEIL